MKLCKDCRFMKPSPGFPPETSILWTCTAPQNGTINLLDGGKTVYVHYCYNARGAEQYCGQEGKWFESIPSEVQD